jgi:hypothetical protein
MMLPLSVKAAPVGPEEFVFRDYDDLVRKHAITIQNYNNEYLDIQIQIPQELVPYITIHGVEQSMPKHFLEKEIPFRFDFPSEKKLKSLNDTEFIIRLDGQKSDPQIYTIPLRFKDSITFPKPKIVQFFSNVFSFFTGRSVQESASAQGENNKMLFRSMIIILLLVTGSLGTYMNYRYLKNRYTKRPLRSVNLSLLSYIISQLMKDTPKQQIVQSLIQHNWDKDRIEQHFDIAISYKYNLRLLKYILHARQKNMSVEQIRNTLLEHRWDSEVVGKHLDLLAK